MLIWAEWNVASISRNTDEFAVEPEGKIKHASIARTDRITQQCFLKIPVSAPAALGKTRTFKVQHILEDCIDRPVWVLKSELLVGIWSISDQEELWWLSNACLVINFGQCSTYYKKGDKKGDRQNILNIGAEIWRELNAFNPIMGPRICIFTKRQGPLRCILKLTKTILLLLKTGWTRDLHNFHLILRTVQLLIVWANSAEEEHENFWVLGNRTSTCHYTIFSITFSFKGQSNSIPFAKPWFSV